MSLLRKYASIGKQARGRNYFPIEEQIRYNEMLNDDSLKGTSAAEDFRRERIHDYRMKNDEGYQDSWARSDTERQLAERAKQVQESIAPPDLSYLQDDPYPRDSVPLEEEMPFEEGDGLLDGAAEHLYGPQPGEDSYDGAIPEDSPLYEGTEDAYGSGMPLPHLYSDTELGRSGEDPYEVAGQENLYSGSDSMPIGESVNAPQEDFVPYQYGGSGEAPGPGSGGGAGGGIVTPQRNTGNLSSFSKPQPNQAAQQFSQKIQGNSLTNGRPTNPGGVPMPTWLTKNPLAGVQSNKPNPLNLNTSRTLHPSLNTNKGLSDWWDKGTSGNYTTNRNAGNQNFTNNYFNKNMPSTAPPKPLKSFNIDPNNLGNPFGGQQ